MDWPELQISIKFKTNIAHCNLSRIQCRLVNEKYRFRERSDTREAGDLYGRIRKLTQRPFLYDCGDVSKLNVIKIGLKLSKT